MIEIKPGWKNPFNSKDNKANLNQTRVFGKKYFGVRGLRKLNYQQIEVQFDLQNSSNTSQNVFPIREQFDLHCRHKLGRFSVLRSYLTQHSR